MLLKEALNAWFITLMERSSWSSQQLISKYEGLGNSLEVQWLGLCTSTVGVRSLVWGLRSGKLHSTAEKRKNEKKKGR